MSISSVQEKKRANKKKLPCLPCKALPFSGEGSRLKMHFLQYSGTVLPKPRTKHLPVWVPTPQHPEVGAVQATGAPGKGFGMGHLAQRARVCLQSHQGCTCHTSCSIHMDHILADSSLPTWHSSHTGSLLAPIPLLRIWVLSVPAVSSFETM